MDKKAYYPERKELLRMPVSIRGWIVLKDYASHFGDLLILQKIITDYLTECPLFELDQLLKISNTFLSEKDFQKLMIFLFKQSHLIYNEYD